MSEGEKLILARMVDVVFPGDTNHHGTLFGGAGLAHMDKIAFIAATRHAHVDFVTASCERIDFKVPAKLGDIVELTGSLTRVGRRSLAIEVEMIAETLLTGERNLCSKGVFNMVGVGQRLADIGGQLPQAPATAPHLADQSLRMVEMVFPEQTSHYGNLQGGWALGAMGKAAFIAATRRSRMPVMVVSCEHVRFQSQAESGEIIELIADQVRIGRSSITVGVELWSENLWTGQRRLCAEGRFILVAVDENRRPAAIMAA